LREDGAYQFTLPPVEPPAPPPAWLQAVGRWLRDLLAPVGRFFRWLGSLIPDAPYAKALFWTLLAAVLLAIGWAVVQRVRSGEWRLPRFRRKPMAEQEEEAWTPEAAPARAWLEEADRLAADGRYAEAVHHLLFRSVEDIGRRRPHLVRPALTSRELARAAVLPPAVRDLFADIARLVERSLFGGRAVALADWQAARAAYADLATPRAWRK
jgi:hypothetical protein